MKTPMFCSPNPFKDTNSQLIVSEVKNMGVNFLVRHILGSSSHTLTKTEVVNLIAALSNFLAEEEIPKLEKYSPIGT